MHKLARLMAILGGLVLTALIVLVCLSVFGRTMNGVLHGIGTDWAKWLLDMGVGPINGDFELVEAGVAFAIFAFLPICHLTGGHATVDIFTSKLPAGVNRFLRMVIEIIFAAVLVMIALRLYSGMLSKLSYGETTFLLQFPIWWAYAASLFGAVIAAVVGVYIALMCIIEAFTGRTILPVAEEPNH